MIEYAELDILIEEIMRLHGFDFSSYAMASLNRRVSRIMMLDGFANVASLIAHLRAEPGYITRFVEEITVNVTEMFRDPDFYVALRTKVLPVLGTYPHIRIWHAGCSSGEEVYSMAILLKEAGLLEKSLLYATDINPRMLEKSRAGIYKLSNMQQASTNYIASGGRHDFSSYYTAQYHHAKLDDSLRNKIIFSTHNLVTDGSFNEFQLILCRNVLIYFERNLQDKVQLLFDASLERLGFLALGSKESIRFSSIATRYIQVGNQKIWRKKE